MAADEPVSGSRASTDASVTGRHQRLFRRTLLVSLLTLGSRILGFVREVISAALFGDKAGIFDAFLTAWRIPNLFRRFLGEGALSTALVTNLTELDHSEGVAAGSRLFWNTLRLVAGILALLCAAVMLLAWLLPSLVSDATLAALLGKDHGPVLELTIRVMPFVVLVCLSAILGGALNVRDHFLMPLIAPVLFNAGWILALVVVGMHFGWTSPFAAEAALSTGGELAPAHGPDEVARQLGMTRWLAWGVLGAGVLQLVCQVPALARTGFFGARSSASSAPATSPSAASPWRVIKTSAPLAFGAAIYQVNVMVDGFMAEALLADGGPTAHYYANRVQQFPFALIALAATASVFPRLKVHGHLKEWRPLRNLHDRTQLAVAFLALPASIGLFLLAGPIASLLFGHGAYGDEGVGRVAAALAMLALALLPAGSVSLITRAFYALDDFRTPVVVSSVLLVLNVVLNLLFVALLGMDVEGLALATMVTSWCNLGLLLPILVRRLERSSAGAPDEGEHGESPRAGLGAGRLALRLAPMLLASLAAGLLALGAQRGLVGRAGEALALLAAAVAGIGGYLVLVALFGVPEWRELRSKWARR